MMAKMIEAPDLRLTRMPLNNGAGQIPALGFGTLIPDAALTRTATRDALDAGFRHFDCAERYRNEREVGEALQAGFAAGGIAREDIFVTAKLWNTNHRPERVGPAFEASLDRLRLNYLDLYLIHTPFAFQPGEDQDPRDQDGNVLYDRDVTLLDTWRVMESLVDGGRCRAIGLSDISLHRLLPIYESARIKPAVIQVEAHPYHPQTEHLEFSGSWNEAGAARRSSDLGHRCAGWKDAGPGAFGLGGATRHGFADHAQDCRPGEREFQHIRPSRRRI
jgi:alcohol dehydrogenase (NADP+)